MRLDRAVTVHLCHRVLRLLAERREARTPILMYHGIAEGTGTKHPYYETRTSRQMFAQQMNFLWEHRYSTMTVDDAVKSLEADQTSRKRVAITFDDGYRDFYSHAYPILAEYNFTATVFLITKHVRDQMMSRPGIEYMSWHEVRELHAKGIQIGSHTVTHPELRFLSSTQINYEVGASKGIIEDKIGGAVKSFSYPFAFPEANKTFTRFLVVTLRKHGYENGVSTIIGTAGRNDDRFFLPRLPVNTWDDLRFFHAKLEGAYDWLYLPQRMYKTLKHHAKPLRRVGDLKRSLAEPQR